MIIGPLCDTAEFVSDRVQFTHGVWIQISFLSFKFLIGIGSSFLPDLDWLEKSWHISFEQKTFAEHF